MTTPIRALLLAVLLPMAAGAQAPTPAQDCSAPEHRQFDFWIGEWTVTAGGKAAGTNRIESVLKGCAIVEQWTSARGGHGTSLNFYDRATTTWSQAWMDEGGNALHLRGGLVEGRMVLSSAPRETGTGVDVQRITWSKNPDGTVRQLWEASADGGRTWRVAFDGLYTARR